MKRLHKLLASGMTLCVLVVLSVMAVFPVFADAAVAKVSVTSVNVAEAFPDVKLQVLVLDDTGAFIPGLDASQFSIVEDDKPVAVRAAAQTSLPLNSRIVFIVDELAIAGKFPDVRDAMLSYVKNDMRSGDSVEVLAAADGSHTQVIVPMTSDPNAVTSGIDQSNYDPSSATSTDLLSAVQQGLSDLSTLSQSTQGNNTIVAFSLSILDQRQMKVTVQQAVDAGIPVHTVLLGDKDASDALGRLARGTHAGSEAIIVPDVGDVLKGLNDQGSQDQYLVTYRSKATSTGDHHLVVQVGGISSEDVAFSISEDNLAAGGGGACPGFVSQYVPGICSSWSLILKILGLTLAMVVVVVAIAFVLTRRRSPGVRKARPQPKAAPARGIETRFVEAGVDSAMASLRVVEGKSGTSESVFPIQGTTTLGRSSEHARLALQSKQEGSPISRLHCTLLEKNGSFEIRDEGSANGTSVNGMRLRAGQAQPLNDGDIIELAQPQQGGLKLEFRLLRKSPGPGSSPTVAPGRPAPAKDAAEEKPGSRTPTLPM